MTLLRVPLVLFAFAIGPAGLAAQSPDTLPTQVEEVGAGSPAKAYALGAGLGLGGFFSGGLVGIALSSGCQGDEYCGLEGFLIGAAVGGTLGMAIGVHLGNDRRGSLPLDFLTGAGIWGIGIGAAAISDWDDTVTAIAAIGVPIAQLLGTVAVERATGRSRTRSSPGPVSVYVGPQPGGGAVLAAAVRL